MGKASNQDEDQPKDDPSTITQEQGYWQETCLGVWTRNKNQSHPSSDHPTHSHICNGINFVKIFNLDPKTVKPSPTRGLQLVVVQSESTRKETLVVESNESSIKSQQSMIDDKSLVNTKRNEPYHRSKSPNVNNVSKESDSLFTKIASVLYSKYTTASNKIKNLINSPHPKQDIINDTKDISRRYSSTIRHLYSHVKVNERIDQTGKFVVTRLRKISTWWDNNKGN